MKFRRGLCLLLVFKESAIVAPFPLLDDADHNLMKRGPPAALMGATGVTVADPLADGAKIADQVKNVNKLDNVNNLDSVATTKTLQGDDTAKVAQDAGTSGKTVNSVGSAQDARTMENAAEGCPLGLRRRSYRFLRKRGCVGAVGTGLKTTGDKFTKIGDRLHRFEKYFAGLSRAEKAKWIGKKAISGTTGLLLFGPKMLWRIIKLFSKGILIGGKAFKKGVIVGGKAAKKAAIEGGKAAKTGAIATGKAMATAAMFTFAVATWPVIMFAKILKFMGSKAWAGAKGAYRLGRVGLLKGWSGFGKGLDGLGSKLQKGGKAMKNQADRKLNKSSPPQSPPTQQAPPPASQPPTSPDRHIPTRF